MKHRSGCLICGAEIIYKTTCKEYSCEFCELTYQSNALCNEGHYICDDCHAEDAGSLIKKTCLKSQAIDPAGLALKIMKHPSISMHGPEHHFLVPAVLLTAYANKTGKTDFLTNWIRTAEFRAANVLGGFCGFYGACGAGIGTGIFMSIISEATPLSKEEWANANLLTSKSLNRIAGSGGPGCCKRDSLIAIGVAIEFLKNEMNIDLSGPGSKSCVFSGQNKHCLLSDCEFFQNNKLEKHEN